MATENNLTPGAMGDVGAMQATQSPPPAKKEEPEKPPFAWLIEMVDSRFLDYDKPMTLALVIGSLTLILGIVVLIITLSIESHTSAESITYPQFYGDYSTQRNWYRKMVTTQMEKEANVKTTVSTELCIEVIKIQVAAPSCLVPAHNGGGYCQNQRSPTTGEVTNLYNSAMPFWSQSAGQYGAPYLENCWPGDEFLAGNSMVINHVNGVEQPAVWKNDPGAEPAISLCPGAYEHYTVKAGIPNANGGLDHSEAVGGDAIKAIPAAWMSEITCSPKNHQNGMIAWVVEYKQTITTKSTIKPTFFEALGNAFAYAAYIQVVLTAILVNTMILSGNLKQTGEDGIDDSATLQEIAMEMGSKAALRASGGK